MSSEKRHHDEIDSDLEEDTPINKEFQLDDEEGEEGSGLQEKSNTILSSQDENDNKKNRSIVWEHFERFVDNKGMI
jgi:hypothetical protein